MLFKGHGEVERLNGSHDRLEIRRVHLAAHVIHVDGVAVAQSAIVRGGEPAVPFDAVVLIEVARHRQVVIRTLPAVSVASVVIECIIAPALRGLQRINRIVHHIIALRVCEDHGAADPRRFEQRVDMLNGKMIAPDMYMRINDFCHA